MNYLVEWKRAVCGRGASHPTAGYGRVRQGTARYGRVRQGTVARQGLGVLGSQGLWRSDRLTSSSKELLGSLV